MPISSAPHGPGRERFLSERSVGPSALTRYDPAIIAVTTLAAAFGAIAADAAPSGLSAADAVFRGAVAAVVTVAGSRARRWTGVVLAAVAVAVAVAVAQGLLLVPAVVALLLSLLALTREARLRVLGAVVAGLAIQVLFRQSDIGFQGASTLIGGAAVLPVLVSAHNQCWSPVRRRNRRVAAVAGGIMVVATVAFGMAMVLARHDLETGAARARSALAAARAGDSDTAQRALRESAEAFRRSASLTGSWWAAPARMVPGVGQQAKAVSLVTDEGENVVRSARVTAAVGDYRRLKYQSGGFDVEKLRQLQRPLAASAAALDRADHRMDDLDRGWLIAPLRSRVDEFADEIARATREASLASSVIDLAPALLGGDGPRHYFLAFINPAELRGAGGFIGNFGELTASDGRIRLTRSGAISELIDAAPPGKRMLTGPKDYLRRYGEFLPADFFQDVTFSPHFPFDADVIEQLYPQSGGRRVDGVISIDPIALAALLRFTGPITVEGLDIPLTSANAADILLREQYVRFGEDDRRKDLLEEASRVTFDRLTTGSLPSPGELTRVLGPMVAQRRIMLHAVRTAEQSLFTRVHADGAVPAPDGGDVLSIASSNVGNNKIDAYLHREVSYDTHIDPSTGGVDSTVTVRLRNDAPARGLPSAIIGNAIGAPPGTNVMSLSVYSPLQLGKATISGDPVTMRADQEAGLRVYSVDLTIPPGSSRVVHVQLAGTMDLRSGYRLVAMPQPVVNPDRITVRVRTAAGWRVEPGPDLRREGDAVVSPLRRLDVEGRYRVDVQGR